MPAIERKARRRAAGHSGTDTTVRIDKKTSAALARLAKETGRAKKEIVARAIDRMRRERILEAANAGFAAQKADPEAWAAELAERAEWDTAIADGLD